MKNNISILISGMMFNVLFLSYYLTTYLLLIQRICRSRIVIDLLLFKHHFSNKKKATINKGVGS